MCGLVCGPLSFCVALCPCVWPSVHVCGPLSLCVALCPHVWPRVWPSVPVCDPLSPYVALCPHVWALAGVVKVELALASMSL